MKITLKERDEFPDASGHNFKLTPKAAGTYEVERKGMPGGDWYFFLGSKVGAQVEYFHRLARKGEAVIEGDLLFNFNIGEVKS